ncbi:MAG: DegT/DnrJ/EryC1/StrS family aminotransferase [Treponema sp.]|nr:DegT/DnrJ/EryC1/StrS family aminotransferase [Treponema sp.]
MKIEIHSPTIRRKEMDAVLTAMVEEKIGPGERCRLLIQTAKDQLSFDYALALRSPAVALFLALKALAKPGSAVLLSALSPRYYLQVLSDLQLTPVYCDVSYDLPVISKESAENAVLKKPSDIEIGAVIVHHTLGYVPDTASIAELGYPVIEDISRSYGFWLKPAVKKSDDDSEAKTKPDKKNEETSGSPFPVPNSPVYILGLEERDMLTSGGGALLFSMNRKDSALLRAYAGIADEYCLADINAALAVVQFKEISRNIERRRTIAEVYHKACLSLSSRTKHKRFIPLNINDNEYCNYAFSLTLDTGLKDVIAYAKKKDIETENSFENTIAQSGFDLGSACPVSSSLILRTINFPIYPRLRSQDVERITRLIMTLP